VTKLAGQRSGFTLVEVLVVLILLGVVAGLVAPALRPPPRPDESGVAALVRRARQTAARRGETIYLGLSPTGAWRIDGAASLAEGALATGAVTDYAGPPATLVISPIGTCAFDLRSGAAASTVAIDVLTCEVLAP